MVLELPWSGLLSVRNYPGFAMQKQQVVEKKHIVKQHAIQLLRSICNYLQDRDTSVFIEWMRFLDVAHEFPTYVATLNEAPMNIFKYKRFELCKKSCPVAVFQWQLPRQLKMKSLWPLWGHGKWKISRVWLPKWSANYFPWIFLSWWPQSHGEKDDEFKLIFFSPQPPKLGEIFETTSSSCIYL